MTQDAHNMEELIAAAADGSLDAAGHDQLQRLLAEDPDALRRYVHTMLLSNDLAWELSRGQGATDAADPSPVVAVIKIKPAPPAPVRLARALAAALLLAAAAAAIYLASLGSGGDRQPRDADLPIATLIDASGSVLIGDRFAAPGAELSAGDIAVESGSAEFHLNSGALVRLRPGTRMTLLDPMRAVLGRGFASFDCPPSAHGFAVELPDGSRIVDLGTRFSVGVGGDPTAPPHVAVSEGRVRIERGSASRELEAGQIATLPARSDRIEVAAAFDLFDDFEGDASGPLIDRGDWAAFPAHTGTVGVRSTDGGANRALYYKGLSAGGQQRGFSRALGDAAIAVGGRATLYLRVMATGPGQNASFGLADRGATGDLRFDDFAVQLAITGDGPITRLVARNGDSVDPIATLTAGHWHELWLVIDHGSSRFDVYIRGGEYAEQTQIAGDLRFRRASTGELRTFMGLTGVAAAQHATFIDDIRFAPGEQLSSPIEASPLEHPTPVRDETNPPTDRTPPARGDSSDRRPDPEKRSTR